MNDKAERVQALLRRRGVKEREMKQALADACGIRYQSVQGWFTGASKNITADNLAAIAKRWNGSLVWLITGEGEMASDEGAPPEQDYELIPQYSARLSAGEGFMNGYVEITGALAFKKSWLAAVGAKTDNLLVASITGQSMYPTIHDGEVVLVDTAQREPISGRVYAIVRPDNELSAKRLVKPTVGDAWVIRSDNPDKRLYGDEEASADTLHSVPILGRIIWRGGGGGL